VQFCAPSFPILNRCTHLSIWPTPSSRISFRVMQDPPTSFLHQSRHHCHRRPSCTLTLPHTCPICAMHLSQQRVFTHWPGSFRPPTAKHETCTIEVVRFHCSRHWQGACTAACQLHGVQSRLLTVQPQTIVMQCKQVSLPRRFAPEPWPHPNAAVGIIVSGSGGSFRVARCDCSRRRMELGQRQRDAVKVLCRKAEGWSVLSCDALLTCDL
jgi:hypothetical protein